MRLFSSPPPPQFLKQSDPLVNSKQLSDLKLATDSKICCITEKVHRLIPYFNGSKENIFQKISFIYSAIAAFDLLNRFFPQTILCTTALQLKNPQKPFSSIASHCAANTLLDLFSVSSLFGLFKRLSYYACLMTTQYIGARLLLKDGSDERVSSLKKEYQAVADLLHKNPDLETIKRLQINLPLIQKKLVAEARVSDKQAEEITKSLLQTVESHSKGAS